MEPVLIQPTCGEWPSILNYDVIDFGFRLRWVKFKHIKWTVFDNGNYEVNMPGKFLYYIVWEKLKLPWIACYLIGPWFTRHHYLCSPWFTRHHYLCSPWFTRHHYLCGLWPTRHQYVCGTFITFVSTSTDERSRIRSIITRLPLIPYSRSVYTYIHVPKLPVAFIDWNDVIALTSGSVRTCDKGCKVTRKGTVHEMLVKISLMSEWFSPGCRM